MWNPAVPEQQSILIVDDDRAIRGWLAERLSEAGYRAMCAANGRDALCTIARHGTPDLILLDVLMPEMNGLQLLQVLHGEPETAAVPVVMLSSFGPEWAPPHAANLRAWLQKPVEIEQLLKTIELCHQPSPVGA